MTRTIKPAEIRPYVGNGPYCFTNALVSMLGADAPTPAVVETLTGAPFGFQLLAGRLPMFDPFGWDPDIGLDQAAGLLGYTASRETFDSADAALAALSDHLRTGPVLVGPVDMGLLLHQPGNDRAVGADHFVVALEIRNGTIAFHDPEGHPWATLPSDAFCEAWKGEQIGYLDGAYAMRTDFEAVEDVKTFDAIRASLPYAAAWMVGRDLPVPPGTLGGRQGLEQLADILSDALDDDLRGLLINFGIRVGARRKADGAHCLHAIGDPVTAAILQEQARILGSLQYTAIRSDRQALAAGFWRLGELHDAATECLSKYLRG